MTLGDVNSASDRHESEDARMKQYKNLAKHEDMRRRRTECSVELRKQKRDDMMMKRRNLAADDSEEDASDNDVSGESKQQNTSRAHMTNEKIISVLSNNPTIADMRMCFECIRRSLSKSKSPPVDDVIKSGLLQALVQALSVDDEKVRFEAAWGLTNIVSGTSEQTVAAVQAGATAPLIALTMAPQMQLAEQALWAVANIAGDSAQLRDFVIENHGVDALMHLVASIDHMEVTFARTLAWAFSNMCRHKNPHAPLQVLEVLSKGLAKLVQHQDKQVRQDACWAVSYLTDGPDAQIQLAVDSGVLPFVLNMLRETDSMTAPALRVLGNMATGNDDLTQKVIELGTLQEIGPLTERAKSQTIVKECCWLVSNVIAGTQPQIQAVLDAGILPLIIEVLLNGEFKSQFEASWAIANLAQGGTSQQILTLWHDGAVPVLCSLLKSKNIDMLSNTLEALHALLTVVSTVDCERIDELRDLIEENKGLDYLEKLQESESEKIYNMSYRIISDFFGNDDEEEGCIDENVEPRQYVF